MKVVIAIDSFKGSLTSNQVGNAVADGIRKVYSDVDAFVSPIADGGEGTLDALLSYGGTAIQVNVTGPLGDKIPARYGIWNDNTAIIEMSAAAGITLISAAERNPMHTTTYGVGEIILDAISKGCRKFIIGIGGSATNDGGVGMLQALGIQFINKDDNPIPHGAIGLEHLKSINLEGAEPRLKECTFYVACDVKNPLCGTNGCSSIYGPQKGATTEMIQKMDMWLSHYANLTQAVVPNANPNFPGAGAAGGMGFAFLTYLNATLTPGIELIIRETHLEDKIKQADIIITGEGRLDEQSCMGKAPIGVAALAKKYHKPVIAFCGSTTPGAKECNKHGIDAYFPILQSVCTLEQATDQTNACRNASDTAEQVFRLIKTIQ